MENFKKTGLVQILHKLQRSDGALSNQREDKKLVRENLC